MGGCGAGDTDGVLVHIYDLCLCIRLTVRIGVWLLCAQAPIFNKREMNLLQLWQAVQGRGGSAKVGAGAGGDCM